MNPIDMTRMSEKGQVVIPGDIRAALGLGAGTKFVVFTEGDMVLLKRIGRPSKEEIAKLFAQSEQFAKRAGLKSSDVKKHIRQVRRK
jgi:AbrB family looped-hinge helix DNA binding protein